MNGKEITLSTKSMHHLLKTGEVIFNYLGVLYKVKKHAKTDNYRLYCYNVKRTANNPKEWKYLMNIEEPICLEETSTNKNVVHD